jgi:hypothetical protein
MASVETDDDEGGRAYIEPVCIAIPAERERETGKKRSRSERGVSQSPT